MALHLFLMYICECTCECLVIQITNNFQLSNCTLVQLLTVNVKTGTDTLKLSKLDKFSHLHVVFYHIKKQYRFN